MASTNRIIWIDCLKGFAILAVVLGHITTPLSQFIYSWHIPLFFFISGVLLNSSRNSLKKDFTRLIAPFIVFSLVGLAAEYVKRFIWPSFNFAYENINLREEIFGILWWMDFSHLHHYGFVLWFLPALFWAKNIYLLLVKYLKNSLAVTLISLVILLYLSNQVRILPFGLDEGLTGLFWLSLGWLLTGKFWVVSIISLLFLKIPQTNLALKVIDLYGLFYSLIIINSLVGLFKWGGKKLKFLEQFGNNSIFILIVHPYLNNLVYFITEYWLKLSWLVEIIVIYFFMDLFLKNIISISMVLKYIWVNNPIYQVPFRIIYSASVLLYQSLTGKSIVIKNSDGRKVKIHPGCIISRMFLYTDLPDKNEIELLRSKIDNQSIFLDIGANIGNYSIGLSNSTKSIYAFEPSPVSFSYCQENFELNGIDKNNVIKIALSDKPGIKAFTDYGGSSTTNRLVNKNKSSINVKVETLDKWVAKYLKNRKFNLVMNIDVEGNQLNVLKGARKLLSNNLIKGFTFEEFDKNSLIFSYIKSFDYKITQVFANNYYAEKI